MRKSKIESAATRNRIVAAAAREFRQKGIHATGLAGVMAAAGLTHGGFYRHFDSKDQLVAEACAASMQNSVELTEGAASQEGGEKGLETILEIYLAAEHRDRADCCPLVSLGSELARADRETRATASAGFLKLVDLVAKQYRNMKPRDARSTAIFAVAAMIGAMTMSRIVPDAKLAAAILKETKRHLANP
jgi:TetR/AcrR family transcriptional repressor of nem operon